MQPKIELLSPETVDRVIGEALQLLDTYGVRVQNEEALDLLDAAWCIVDRDQKTVKIPGEIVEAVLKSVPHEFWLHDAAGTPSVHYGGDSVTFDPGSSGVNVLDRHTGKHRPAVSGDLLRVIQIAEMLPEYGAQSTALVCSDVPKEIGDFYRLYLVLMHSRKPVVTGSFTTQTIQVMIDLLAAVSGGRDALALRPRAVFDVCPTPPLIWSSFACQNLIELARASVPVEMVSMPLAGVGSPVTLLGSIVQHSAESLSGIVIHQLAKQGSPIVWGGAPAIFDMRQATTPMGAVETAMIDAGYAQVGKTLGLPTHAYLGASDSKTVDAQAGLESGMTALIGALAGINMISGAGMLDFLACVSPEKLVLDAEGIRMTRRLLDGIQAHTPTLALELFEGFQFKPDFLKQKATRDLFSREQAIPSAAIDRGSLRSWLESGSPDAFQRACSRADELVSAYTRPDLPGNVENELKEIVLAHSRSAGMDRLPPLEAG